MDRRQLLLGAAALIGCKGTPSPSDTDAEPPVPAPDREPSPPALGPAGEPDLHVFPWGVYVGDPTVDGVEVRVRCTEAAFELVVYAWDGGWTESQRLPLVPAEVTASTRITATRDADQFARAGQLGCFSRSGNRGCVKRDRRQAENR